MKKKNGKFFKEKCNKCGNYGHSASDCWENSNKNYNRKNNKTAKNPRFTGNAKTVEKEATRLLIFGRRKERRKTMASTTSLWEAHSMDNFKKKTMKKTSENGQETAEYHHISHIRRETRHMSKNTR